MFVLGKASVRPQFWKMNSSKECEIMLFADRVIAIESENQRILIDRDYCCRHRRIYLSVNERPESSSKTCRLVNRCNSSTSTVEWLLNWNTNIYAEDENDWFRWIAFFQKHCNRTLFMLASCLDCETHFQWKTQLDSH